MDWRVLVSTRELIGAFPFEIDVRVPIQLGRESISNSVVAFSELVKNSYDADAEQVLIKFREMSTNTPTIMIEDNGSGMNQSSLLDNWLLIGTRNKHADKISGKKKRAVTGEKGLGRLGIDRLCKKLILQTKTEQMGELLELHVEWAQYEGESLALSDVKHELFKVKPASESDENFTFCSSKSFGTRIILEDLKDTWTEGLIEDLNKELSLLVSPFGGLNDFKIKMELGEESLHLTDPSGMLNAAQWVLDAELDESGTAKASMRSDLYGESVEMAPASWRDWIKDRKEIPQCGPIKFKMYFIPQKADVLKSLNFTKKDHSEFMSRNQGVRIYRDHFRVKPYGDPSGKGDWLDLALRRVQNPAGIDRIGWRVGPNQVVGAVFISHSKNRKLEDQTNREGLLEGPAFYDLQAAIIKFIQFFESEAHKSVSRKKPRNVKADLEAKIDNSKQRTQESLDVAKKLKDRVEKTSSEEERKEIAEDLEKQLNEVRRALDETAQHTSDLKDVLENEVRTLGDEKNTLSNLASLGILTVAFSHEALEQSNLAATNAGQLRRDFDAGFFDLISGPKEKFLRKIEIIRSSTRYVRNFSRFALGSVRPDKRTRKNLQINKVISDVFDALAQSFEQKEITVDLNEVPASIAPIRAFEIDWESILINLITNSIHAFEKIRGKENRVIRVSLTERKTEVFLSFADSGRGIEAGTEESIFEPMFSTRRNAKGKVEGTGMGLSLVKTFVEDHSGGRIKVVSPGCLGGAEFQICVPRSDTQTESEHE
jgi:signal transduction histidine kinase